MCFDEVDVIAGGPGPAVPAVVGGVIGGGVALFTELTDDNPGVNGGNVVIGAAAGAGAAITATLGAVPAIAGGLGFGVMGVQSTRVNTQLSN